MKKTIFTKFTFLLFLSVFSISCSSDDNGISNQAPATFNLNNVADGATEIELQPSFDWQVATDPDGDEVTYDFYLDTQNPPANKMAADLSSPWFDAPEELDPETTYYWQVVAKDPSGNEMASEIASFTTRSLTTKERLLGKWYYDRQIINGTVEELPDCDKNSSLEFKENDIVIIDLYFEDSNGDCVYNGQNQVVFEATSETELELSGSGSTEVYGMDLTENELKLSFSGSNSQLILVK